MPQELLEQLTTYRMLVTGEMTTASSAGPRGWHDTTAEDTALMEREIIASIKRWLRSHH